MVRVFEETCTNIYCADFDQFDFFKYELLTNLTLSHSYINNVHCANISHMISLFLLLHDNTSFWLHSDLQLIANLQTIDFLNGNDNAMATIKLCTKLNGITGKQAYFG